MPMQSASRDRQTLSQVPSRQLLLWVVLVALLVLLNACETGIYHRVETGQTLYRISRTYGVDETYLARLNNIHDPTQLQVGTRLFIPGADRVRRVTPAVSTPPSRLAKPTPKPSQPRVISTKPKKSVSVPKSTPARQERPQQPTEPVKKLSWPARGKIVRTFSDQVRTGGGKGIEIALRAGSPVKAAAAGKVIYSGDGINGYGFLVILQHENELFTVYGFNQRNLVKQGGFVSRGDKLALSGVPPSGGEPRLHFEVRKGKQAVNPILYLP